MTVQKKIEFSQRGVNIEANSVSCRAVSIAVFAGLLLVLVAPALGAAYSHTYTAAASAEDWFYGGDATGDEVGCAVASAGDVDGDGYGDVAVGACKDRLTLDKEGVVSVFYGGPQGLHFDPSWQEGSGVPGSLFGAAVASAGDVDGDGYDDLLIGAPEFKWGGNKKGAAFIYLGSSVGLKHEPAWFATGDEQDGQYGYAVAGAGDVNGDGCDDWLVGARYQSPTDDLDAGEGAVYLFFGCEDLADLAPDWKYDGDHPHAHVGASVAGAGDVNADGYADILVGAPDYTADFDTEGAMLLFLGGEGGPGPVPDWLALGGQAGAKLGISVAGAGDVDGDGYDDVLAGAPHLDTTRDDSGAMLLFYGQDPVPTSSPTILAGGLRTGSLAGFAVAGGGDLDGDGYDDVLTGAYLAMNDQRAEGLVFAFYGSDGGVVPRAGWRAEGNKADSEFGFAVAIAHGLRGTDVGSVLVGAPAFKQNTEREGRAIGYYAPLLPDYPNYRVHLPLVVRTQP